MVYKNDDDGEASRRVSDQQTAVTAKEIFGIPEGRRAVLERTMADYVYQVVKSKRPEVGAAIEALEGKSATMATANDDMAELKIDGRVEIGGAGHENITVRLERSAGGLFRLKVSGEGQPPLMYEAEDLAIGREGERYVLTSGGPRLRFSPKEGEVGIEVYTAPFLAQVPAVMRAFAPEIVGLFKLRFEPM